MAEEIFVFVQPLALFQSKVDGYGFPTKKYSVAVAAERELEAQKQQTVPRGCASARCSTERLLENEQLGRRKSNNTHR